MVKTCIRPSFSTRSVPYPVVFLYTHSSVITKSALGVSCQGSLTPRACLLCYGPVTMIRVSDKSPRRRTEGQSSRRSSQAAATASEKFPICCSSEPYKSFSCPNKYHLGHVALTCASIVNDFLRVRRFAPVGIEDTPLTDHPDQVTSPNVTTGPFTAITTNLLRSLYHY